MRGRADGRRRRQVRRSTPRNHHLWGGYLRKSHLFVSFGSACAAFFAIWLGNLAKSRRSADLDSLSGLLVVLFVSVSVFAIGGPCMSWGRYLSERKRQQNR